LIDVAEQQVVRFLRSLRDNGTPAWQRLQAVRAVQSYRTLVLQRDDPSLFGISQTLERIAAGERAGVGPVTVEDQRALVGQLDPKEPKLVREMRAELRLMHYAYDTEKAYIGWVKRFMRHCRSEDLTKFGEGNLKLGGVATRDKSTPRRPEGGSTLRPTHIVRRLVGQSFSGSGCRGQICITPSA